MPQEGELAQKKKELDISGKEGKGKSSCYAERDADHSSDRGGAQEKRGGRSPGRGRGGGVFRCQEERELLFYEIFRQGKVTPRRSLWLRGERKKERGRDRGLDVVDDRGGGGGLSK